MRIHALSRGRYTTQSRFAGRVHSVFAQACNLQTDSGDLMVLLGAASDNLPHGIRLDLPQSFAFDNVLRAGAPLACRAGILRFGDTSALAVDLERACVWQSSVYNIGLDMRGSACASAWQAVESKWRSKRHRSGLTELSFWPNLRAALAERDVIGTVEQLKPLIGRGNGLTPSGDDFIVGLFAGLWAGGRNDCDFETFVCSLAKLLTPQLGATNDISRSFLAAALSGEFSQSLSNLICAVAVGDLNRAACASVVALDLGHSSGVDGVLGVLAGLSVANPSLDPLGSSTFERGLLA